jgi:hypothetical protein
MTLLNKLRSFFNQSEVTASGTVEIQCPKTGTVIATDQTTPARYDVHVGIATYRCDECDVYHTFRWGPPAPLYVSDRHELQDNE